MAFSKIWLLKQTLNFKLPMLQYEINITGRVQGVGYRYYTQKQAKILNLNGWVRNTVDGGVLVVVQGEKAAIETFVDYLWAGPPLSSVKSIAKAEMQIVKEFSDFEVRY